MWDLTDYHWANLKYTVRTPTSKGIVAVRYWRPCASVLYHFLITDRLPYSQFYNSWHRAHLSIETMCVILSTSLPLQINQPYLTFKLYCDCIRLRHLLLNGCIYYFISLLALLFGDWAVRWKCDGCFPPENSPVYTYIPQLCIDFKQGWSWFKKNLFILSWLNAQILKGSIFRETV